MGEGIRFLKSYRDITGRQRHYIRRKGFREIPITAEIGTMEFEEQYRAAMATLPEPAGPRTMTAEIPEEWLDATSGVYFVEAADLIKIGYSVSIRSRLSGLQTGCPVVMRLLHVAVGPPKLERILHRRFAQHRRHGEWFDRAPEILDFIHRKEQIEFESG